jgi:excisionase family DNA binding protein
MSAPDDDLLTVGQARALLGVGKRKMAELLRSGALPSQPDVLDGRIKLVKRTAVDALLRQSKKEAAAA